MCLLGRFQAAAIQPEPAGRDAPDDWARQCAQRRGEALQGVATDGERGRRQQVHREGTGPDLAAAGFHGHRAVGERGAQVGQQALGSGTNVGVRPGQQAQRRQPVAQAIGVEIQP